MIAARFVEEGASVVINGRSQDECGAVASMLGDAALPVAADLARSSDVDALVARAVEHWGTVDVLVNNAGIVRDGFLTRVSDDDWAQVIATNLSGAFFATRAVVPIMKKQQRGSIVNLTSWAGLRGNPGQVAYSTSKAGLHGLTLASAKELARFSIRVNALSPVAPTEMTSEMTEGQTTAMVNRIPLHRLGDEREVAEAALYLASDRASYTTGQVLHVDGGLHLT
jgi:3-oxoacyl-[acyl-carrier protein] reductase